MNKKQSICVFCKWRDWYIEVPTKQPGSMFFDICPYQPELVMKIYNANDCDDFSYYDVK